jgi:hypothetical protein
MRVPLRLPAEIQASGSTGNSGPPHDAPYQYALCLSQSRTPFLRTTRRTWACSTRLLQSALVPLGLTPHVAEST